MRDKKGVAGLNLFLSVVVLLFVIGFIVMIFSLMGGELEDATYKTTTTATINTTTATVVNETPVYLTGITPSAYRSCRLSVTGVINETGNGAVFNCALENYTVSGCTIAYSGAVDVGGCNNSLWNVTGTYTYEDSTTASGVINDSSRELSGVTDWFGIIIVLVAMVVLILLTVIIISAIRGSGMVAMESGGRASADTA